MLLRRCTCHVSISTVWLLMRCISYVHTSTPEWKFCIDHTIPLLLLLLLVDVINKTVTAYKATAIAINSNAFRGFPRIKKL